MAEPPARLQHSDGLYKSVTVGKERQTFESLDELQRFVNTRTESCPFFFVEVETRHEVAEFELTVKSKKQSLLVNQVDEVAYHADFIAWIETAFMHVTEADVANLNENPMLYGLPYVRHAIMLLFGKNMPSKISMGGRAVLVLGHVDGIAITNQLIKRLWDASPEQFVPPAGSPTKRRVVPKNVNLKIYARWTMPYVDLSQVRDFTLDVNSANKHCIPESSRANRMEVTITLSAGNPNGGEWLQTKLENEMRQQCLAKFGLKICELRLVGAKGYKAIVASNTGDPEPVRVLMTLLTDGRELQYLSTNQPPKIINKSKVETVADAAVAELSALCPDKINAELRKIIKVWHGGTPPALEKIYRLVSNFDMYALLFANLQKGTPGSSFYDWAQ